MKTFRFLGLALLACAVLVMTGCNKKNNASEEPVDERISAAELVGSWTFLGSDIPQDIQNVIDLLDGEIPYIYLAADKTLKLGAPHTNMIVDGTYEYAEATGRCDIHTTGLVAWDFEDALLTKLGEGMLNVEFIFKGTDLYKFKLEKKSNGNVFE